MQVNPNNAITRSEPSLWGIATNDLLNTFNSYYDGTSPDGQVTPKYSFANNTNCFAPEPSSALLLIAASGLMIRRRARRA